VRVRNIPDAHFAGRLDGPQGLSGRVRKISLSPGFDPPTVHPVRSRYLGPHRWYKYKVVQIWQGRFVCKQATVCPGHIWTTLYKFKTVSICSGFLTAYSGAASYYQTLYTQWIANRIQWCRIILPNTLYAVDSKQHTVVPHHITKHSIRSGFQTAYSGAASYYQTLHMQWILNRIQWCRIILPNTLYAVDCKPHTVVPHHITKHSNSFPRL
jgi:hypothetical protein